MLLIPTYTFTAFFNNQGCDIGECNKVWGNVSNKVWENLSECSYKVQNHIPLKSLQSLILEGIFLEANKIINFWEVSKLNLSVNRKLATNRFCLCSSFVLIWRVKRASFR